MKMNEKKEKVIIVHLNLGESDHILDDKVKEIEELVRSSFAEVEAIVIQNADTINASTYIGSGKAYEIKEMADNMEVDTILFNNELTGSQMKNLEEIIDKKIVDRTGLILDIFARRATTKEGKLQVKLAQLEYRLPRLVGFRNYLSREGAGIGTRGPGEQKLEMDRRNIQKEITQIKHQLKDSHEQRKIKSNKRKKSIMPIVSIIGYSNAGKSTILNAVVEKYSLDNKKVYSDDMLFATLDISARQIELPNGKDIIMTDTVGFVSDLPTKLIESFKGTLEEIEISDLLVIVVDSSNVDYKMQLKATTSILKDMNIKDKKVLYCFNKIDLNPEFFYDKKDEHFIKISAHKAEDIDKLIEKIQYMLYEKYRYFNILVPYSNIDTFMKLNLKLYDSEYLDEGLSAKIYIEASEVDKYKEYLR